jgi:hypothetical protein
MAKKMSSEYPIKVQGIRSKGQKERLYVSVPMALAAAIGLEAGEEVQWELLDRGELHLVRPNAGAASTAQKSLTRSKERT